MRLRMCSAFAQKLMKICASCHICSFQFLRFLKRADVFFSNCKDLTAEMKAPWDFQSPAFWKELGFS
jgi:hypothetical protein